uniref:Uncharacterized protein n=1 Tax=Arundo donax TaxID=35708 RepID=A0A0A9BTH8_ARUDO
MLLWFSLAEEDILVVVEYSRTVHGTFACQSQFSEL